MARFDDFEHDRSGLLQEPHVLNVGLAQLQALGSQTIVLSRPILFDVPARF